MFYVRVVKPVMDRVLSIVGLVALSPILAILGIAIRRQMGTPVLFRQTRIGLNDEPFLFLKFRSMTGERDEQGNLLPDERRLTAFGKFLRSSSLDELPQLWNVIRGEMSLIGPRPLLPHYLPRYSAFERRRHELRPGITGWCQVNGRNGLSWEEKFKLDVWYVDHRSFFLDMRILRMTAGSVLGRKGISSKGHATMPEFMGSSERDPSDDVGTAARAGRS
jgi:lipopolysaccharide/colanic/teichoic acid biosynthesis glycosyltransferase